MLKLYYYSASTCSQKVLLTLHHKGIPFEKIHVNLPQDEHLTPEYIALNPNGVVPTITQGGVPIVDSSVIMEYLDETVTVNPLMGDTAIDRAHVRAWLRFIEEVPTVAVRIPSFKQVLLKRMAHLDEDAKQKKADKRTIRRGFYHSMKDGISDEREREALSRLRLTFERMEKALAQHRWLVGDEPTLADFAIIPTFDRLEDLGHKGLWEQSALVSRWWENARALEAYKKTYSQDADRLTGRNVH